MAEGRSQEELAGGFLQCVVGGATRRMTTLKLRAEREWKVELGRIIGETELEFDPKALLSGGEIAYTAFAPLMNLPTDRMLELVLAYDRAGALGGREFLEENIDSLELYTILRQILRTVFPFVNDLLGMLNEVRQVARIASLVTSPQSSSMNGEPPTGASPPDDSKPPSTASS